VLPTAAGLLLVPRLQPTQPTAPPHPGPLSTTQVHLRVRREGSDYIVEASQPFREGAEPYTNAIGEGGAPTGREGWTQLRMAHLIEDTAPCGVAGGGDIKGGQGRPRPAAAGLYACSPMGGGFEATFRHLTVRAGRLPFDLEYQA